MLLWPIAEEAFGTENALPPLESQLELIQDRPKPCSGGPCCRVGLMPQNHCKQTTQNIMLAHHAHHCIHTCHNFMKLLTT
eukprot:scaffold90487_cov12-Prasinocladus_malaysianus.AAC.1